ncbi:AbrB/MazE/SpoVT family DNA-binding domain-containing protein [Lysinibacillus sp. K60]|uniref:AbrB/MazE/SpoVT family DNA-binding domain-containing protein n=1 Tax=Lysinibacillus sp. K60 TaxID=2720027 RepID=UPI001C8BC92B|nr:AbrB/MazE/SpoVT family DNA-binding domain-containing protein [Lysinibacillus sp. K60]MBX8942466.1 AbrB/MazE/SpoVT family DNA-binding domain-containing protein [Lysinibacillus sp. K60]
MKSTGILRKVDELGRITLPIELRRSLSLDVKDPLEIFIDGDQIILKKYKPNMACAVTGEVSDDNLVLLGGKLVLSLIEAKKLVTEIELK